MILPGESALSICFVYRNPAKSIFSSTHVLRWDRFLEAQRGQDEIRSPGMETKHNQNHYGRIITVFYTKPSITIGHPDTPAICAKISSYALMAPYKGQILHRGSSTGHVVIHAPRRLNTVFRNYH